ncbi:MAG: D-Ala-D-Ala carboxypeptidase family metallohydrolase [Vicinamibacterales bacterium]
MNGPSPHLSWAELSCKDGTPYPHEWRQTRAVAVAKAFEALRAAVGLPLVVLSGYRTPRHNTRIGGARNSQHVQGRALDLLPPKGWTVLQLAAVARTIPAIRGLGFYRTFLHIDVRESDRLAVWHGPRAEADGEVTALT